MTALLVRTRSGATYTVAGELVTRVGGPNLDHLSMEPFIGFVRGGYPVREGEVLAYTTIGGDAIISSRITHVSELSREAT